MTSRRRPFRRAPLARRSKLALAVAAGVLFAAGLYLGVHFAKPPPPPDFGAPAPAPASAELATVEAPAVPAPAPFEIRRQPPPALGGRPKIALIIDDLGRSVADLDALARLDVPLTYSVLPFESHTSEVVAALSRRRVEYLLHLPMEAKGGANPGPGALLLAMSPEELRDATRRALGAVPGAMGVNNHMGSGISAERDAITAVLSVVAEEKLYYVDSRTSADTLGYSVARQLGVPAAERQVFLDAAIEREAIHEQFDRLLDVARRRGGAIAIAHPHQETLDVLAAAIREARDEGFEFVTASALLDGA
ncbi:MAG TPA: divergent polysaccharide deacetylase family protein [Thermoanaerobaculia bacterium]|jgi:hypothetical protein